MAADYERVLLTKQEVFVYQIPPRTTARGYKASDWNLAVPAWTTRLRMITKGDGKLFIRLEDKISGQLFAQCPVDSYPSPAVEPVSDSSRYFVIRVLNDQTGKQAVLGLGFGDRADSFDFNVALQDFFKEKQTEELIQKEAQREETKPKLDLGFKEGQTITLSIAGKGDTGGARSRPRASAAGGAGAAPLLPPPPSAGNSRRGRSPNRGMPQQQQQSPGEEKNISSMYDGGASGGSFDSSNSNNSSVGDSSASFLRQNPPPPQQQRQPATNQDILTLFG